MLLERPAERRSADRFFIREASRGDAGPLREMLSRCSVGAIYDRFHSPYAVVPGWMADLMVHVDRGSAFVAVAGAEVVGHAMYVRLDDREAEVAVLVEDAWQSRGAGGRLLSTAAEHARTKGVEVLVCETLTDNRRVPALSSAVFSDVERRVEGATTLIRAALV